MDINDKRRENLIPFNAMSPERHKELSAKGGRRTAENKKTRNTIKEDLLILLESKQAKILNGLCDKASKGDPQAVKLIAELIGENGAQKIDATLTTEEDARRDAWKALKAEFDAEE